MKSSRKQFNKKSKFQKTAPNDKQIKTQKSNKLNKICTMNKTSYKTYIEFEA
jgi:hypothetical protein